MTVQEVHQYLTSHDVKPSQQRVAIMQYLLEHHTHPDAEEIFEMLLPSMPTLSKTTVYNTVKLFCDKKAANALYIDEKNVRFDGIITPHAHFRCKKCDHIYDVPLQETDIPPFRGPEGFCPEENQIYFLGTCKQCG